MPDRKLPDPRSNALPRFIFMSRWLQVPLYIGLIVAQGVYVWQFLIELYHLLMAASGSPAAIATPIRSVGRSGGPLEAARLRCWHAVS